MRIPAILLGGVKLFSFLVKLRFGLLHQLALYFIFVLRCSLGGLVHVLDLSLSLGGLLYLLLDLLVLAGEELLLSLLYALELTLAHHSLLSFLHVFKHLFSVLVHLLSELVFFDFLFSLTTLFIKLALCLPLNPLLMLSLVLEVQQPLSLLLFLPLFQLVLDLLPLMSRDRFDRLPLALSYAVL